MEAQEYFNTLIDECKTFSEKSISYKDIYAKLFSDAKDDIDVKRRISEMNDESLLEYFKTSQMMLDVQTVFTKTASFISFCKHIDIDLDLTKVKEVGRLADFLSSYIPFNTEFTVDSDGDIKEKKSKEFHEKFIKFKSSIGKAMNIL